MLQERSANPGLSPSENRVAVQPDETLAPWPERYGMLDAWRGLAALVVVLHHVMPENDPRLKFGHAAVMLFFVISGYCILASAESCRSRGLRFRDYMWRRLRRIYPPYVFSVLFFVVTRLGKAAHGGANQLARPWYVWLQNLTLLQWPTMLVHPQPGPAANPSLFVTVYWSLNYEEQFYLVVGLVMGVALLWGARLPIILGLMALGLAWNIIHPYTVTGFFIEYWPHFAIGAVVFYRLCRVKSARVAMGVDGGLVAFAGLCVLWWIKTRAGSPIGREPALELLVVSCFALFLIITRRWNGRLERLPLIGLLTGLGTISYSLYLIHQFNLNLIRAALHLIVPFAVPLAFWVPMQICGHILLAWAFWYACERPFLNRNAVLRPAGAGRVHQLTFPTLGGRGGRSA